MPLGQPEDWLRIKTTASNKPVSEWLEMVGQFVVKMGDFFFQGNIKKRLASLKKNTSSTNIYKHLPLGNVHLVSAPEKMI